MVEAADDMLGALAGLEGVPSALAAARDGVDALLRDRGRRRTTAVVTAESLLRGAVASAQLAGSSSDLEGVRTGTADALARSAVRLNSGLLALAPVVARSPLEALARMHTLAAIGMVPDSALGRPRPDPHSSALLRELAARLLRPTTAPAIAVAALAHAEIAVAQPFEAGSDLVARAMERLLLMVRGVDAASVIVPEAGHRLAGDDYVEALAAYRLGGLPGARAWLLYTCVALGRGVQASPLTGIDVPAPP